MPKINDLDLKNWKQYGDSVLTDTLWIYNERDNSGVHSGYYHGNFIPQIPRQLLTRFTRAGDFVLDPFAGSGTTLIEAQRLNRNSIGIELREDTAREALGRIRAEGKENIVADILCGDSGEVDMQAVLERYNRKKLEFIIYHPPYWDIIKFSENERDLSLKKSLTEFTSALRGVIANTSKALEKGRYCALVMGDKSEKGEIVPLGFYGMQLFIELGFSLKATIVKNFEETKGKLGQKNLWKYRALSGNFYVFKHEYIFVFQK